MTLKHPARPILIIDDEPQALRKCNRSIPFELDTIVRKGLEKNPEHRYATAREVAEDLRRFLDDKPLLAKPPSLLNRVGRWSRRNKALVTSAAVLRWG